MAWVMEPVPHPVYFCGSARQPPLPAWLLIAGQRQNGKGQGRDGMQCNAKAKSGCGCVHAAACASASASAASVAAAAAAAAAGTTAAGTTAPVAAARSQSVANRSEMPPSGSSHRKSIQQGWLHATTNQPTNRPTDGQADKRTDRQTDFRTVQLCACMLSHVPHRRADTVSTGSTYDGVEE